MLVLGGREIVRVAIVDDEPTSRAALAMCVDDSPLESLALAGPLGELATAFGMIEQEAQGCICDHQLQAHGPYAQFSGAELAAWNNQRGLPSVLCTRYLGKSTEMPMIRGRLRHLPVLRTPDQLEQPEQIVKALEDCVSELGGSFSPERRSWRTQVVVEQFDRNDRTVLVSLPAWQVDDPVRVRIDDVPTSLHDGLGVGSRMFARANIGTAQKELLYIEWPSE